MAIDDIPATGSEFELGLAIKQAKAGDERAFEVLYRATVSGVYGLCLRMTAQVSLAEECTQKTFIQAWLKLDSFRGEAKLQTWLYRIAVNEVLGLQRKGRQLFNPLGSSEEASMEDPAGSLDLEAAIGLLPEKQRQVFVLHGVYGHKHEEVAGMLDIAEGTSKAHYHRARKLLMRALTESEI